MALDPAHWSLLPSVLLFIAAAAVIGVFGVGMTRVARHLATATGMGEAVMGALFVGGSTSLSGIIASLAAAATGHPSLAVSNALGGIAAQTAFLGIADMAYRRANLEHAAASAENLMMSAFLLTLLAVHLVGLALPETALWGVHPLSPLLIVAYVFGVRLLSRTHEMPMWYPRHTADTRTEGKASGRGRPRDNRGAWLRFGAYALVVGTSGWLLSRAGVSIVAATGLTEGIVGGVFMAVSTSLPELVIAVTAVRMKALTLALGDILGGNAFDTLFVALSDVAYRDGSIYAAVGRVEAFWLALAVLMNAILLMGLLHRERRGIANIGTESFLVLVCYCGGVAVIATRF